MGQQMLNERVKATEALYPVYTPKEAFDLVDQRVTFVKKRETYLYWLSVLRKCHDFEAPVPIAEKDLAAAAKFDMYDLENEESLALLNEMVPATASNKFKLPDPELQKEHFRLLQLYLRDGEFSSDWKRKADYRLVPSTASQEVWYCPEKLKFSMKWMTIAETILRSRRQGVAMILAATESHSTMEFEVSRKVESYPTMQDNLTFLSSC